MRDGPGARTEHEARVLRLFHGLVDGLDPTLIDELKAHLRQSIEETARAKPWLVGDALMEEAKCRLPDALWREQPGLSCRLAIMLLRAKRAALYVGGRWPETG